MTQYAYYFLMILSSGLCIPSVILFMECLVAILPLKRRSNIVVRPRPPIAVIVPAHNEAAGIAMTLASIREQLSQHDQLVVVADNCTDETAAVAEPFCSSVLTRNDSINRGKGFALRFALNFLRDRAPEIVVFVDADCTLGPHCLDSLANSITETNTPVQGDYQILSQANSTGGSLISAFAVCVKNSVRPLGARWLGISNLITGSGVGMPWSLTETMQVDQSNIVEDMQLAIDLAIAGNPTRFCEDAQIVSYLPIDRRAVETQRTRWEHGHLATIVTQAPRLIWAAIRNRRPSLIGLALDLAIPPLSLLTLGITTLLLVASTFGFFTGIWLPTIFCLFAGALVFTSIVLAWFKKGHQILPLSKFILIPMYAISKARLYTRFVYRRQTAWVRTDRDVTDVSIAAAPDHSILTK